MPALTAQLALAVRSVPSGWRWASLARPVLTAPAPALVRSSSISGIMRGVRRSLREPGGSSRSSGRQRPPGRDARVAARVTERRLEREAAPKPAYKILRGKKDITEDPVPASKSRQARFFDPADKFGKSSLVYKHKTGELEAEVRALQKQYDREKRAEEGGQAPKKIQALDLGLDNVREEKKKMTRHEKRIARLERRNSNTAFDRTGLPRLEEDDDWDDFSQQFAAANRPRMQTPAAKKYDKSRPIQERTMRFASQKWVNNRDRWVRENAQREARSLDRRDGPGFAGSVRPQKPKMGRPFERPAPGMGLFERSEGERSRVDRSEREDRQMDLRAEPREVREDGETRSRYDRESREDSRISKYDRENRDFGSRDVRQQFEKAGAFRDERPERVSRDSDSKPERFGEKGASESNPESQASQSQAKPESDLDEFQTPDYSDYPISIPYTTAASQFLYGRSVVEAALRSGRRQMYKLYLSRVLGGIDTALETLARENGVAVQTVDAQGQRMLDKMSKGRPHNGCVLEASPLPQPPVLGLGRWTLADGGLEGVTQAIQVPAATADAPAPTVIPDVSGFTLELGRQSREDAQVNGTPRFVATDSLPPLLLLVDQVLDPGNLGAIIRSASFLGVRAVAVSRRSSASLTPVALKASAGAAESIVLLSVDDPTQFLSRSRKAGWQVYAAVVAAEGSRKTTRADLAAIEAQNPLADKPCILVVGSEGDGLPRAIRREADVEVSIPNHSPSPVVDSLNVSVATALLCASFLRGVNARRRRNPKSARDPTKKDELGIW